MATVMNVEFLCPHCGRKMGYHFTRNGVIYNNEIVGRYAGSYLKCLSCGKKISIVLMLKLRKIPD